MKKEWLCSGYVKYILNQEMEESEYEEFKENLEKLKKEEEGKDVDGAECLEEGKGTAKREECRNKFFRAIRKMFSWFGDRFKNHGEQHEEAEIANAANKGSEAQESAITEENSVLERHEHVEFIWQVF